MRAAADHLLTLATTVARAHQHLPTIRAAMATRRLGWRVQPWKP